MESFCCYKFISAFSFRLFFFFLIHGALREYTLCWMVFSCEFISLKRWAARLFPAAYFDLLKVPACSKETYFTHGSITSSISLLNIVQIYIVWVLDFVQYCIYLCFCHLHPEQHWLHCRPRWSQAKARWRLWQDYIAMCPVWTKLERIYSISLWTTWQRHRSLMIHCAILFDFEMWWLLWTS